MKYYHITLTVSQGGEVTGGIEHGLLRYELRKNQRAAHLKRTFMMLQPSCTLRHCPFRYIEKSTHFMWL